MIIISSKNARFRLGAVRQLAAIVLTVGACLALPALAGAQTIDPTDSQYGNTVQQVSEGGSSCQDNSGSGSAAGNDCAPPPAPPTCASSSGSGSGSSSGAANCQHEAGGLPFTGLDVAALAGVAGFLLLAGIGLRRARFGESSEA